MSARLVVFNKIATNKGISLSSRKWALIQIATIARELHEKLEKTTERAMKEATMERLSFLINSVHDNTSIDLVGDLVEIEAISAFVIEIVFLDVVVEPALPEVLAAPLINEVN